MSFVFYVGSVGAFWKRWERGKESKREGGRVRGREGGMKEGREGE